MSADKIFQSLANKCLIFAVLLIELFHTSASLSDSANLDTLELVQVLFRHGDRAPEKPYPTDPYKDESLWPNGWGQLTNLGKMQEYQLGIYLRNRYENFISDKYIPEEIFVMSSDLDRSIMSAELCLAGMFSVIKNETNWNPEINWQPIPLHTIEFKSDNLLHMDKACPKYEDLLYDFKYNSDFMKKINSENAELFKDLSSKSGVNITTISDLQHFYSALLIENFYNLTLPEWTTPLLTDDHFQYLYNLSSVIPTYTQDLQRLRAGELVKYLSNNINKTISTLSDKKTKFVMLSGHDTTLVDLLNTLGVHNMKVPYYGNVLMMELHNDFNSTDEDKYYINIFLRNETSRDAYKLSLPGCSFNCPIDTFFEKVYPVIPNNWDEECQSQILPKSSQLSWIAYFAIGALSASFAGLLIASSLILLKRIRQNKQMRREYQKY